ncbi:hypothetical protein MHPYR_310070 [uncultured Mycobacterium sp.]|uniref:Uncharacterized protein n=1 Tax=uncultured Mycobacterium sp. TaxID=171292 RepID=A0A1Y5PCG0_9MYCO|nr:hypothetical protein MHPYR_310070 [uncultured Mycobacterium sp.]
MSSPAAEVTGLATRDGLILVGMLPFLVMWPFRLAPKWLGAQRGTLTRFATEA